jgi:hypothetical protein
MFIWKVAHFKDGYINEAYLSAHNIREPCSVCELIQKVEAYIFGPCKKALP